MPLPHLSIGTSTNRINLLGEGGWTLDGWEPGGTEYGTIWQESQLADFRQMAAYRDVTVFDTLPLKLQANSQDTAARAIQDMRTIIRLCLDFWSTTWQTSVVYLSARASCETNMRHATVYDMRLVGESSPFGQPFVQVGGGAVMDTLNLIVERGPWLENAPGTGTGVSIGTTQTYDGRTVGNVDSTGTEELSTAARTVFAANKHNVAQLTDVYHWDDSTNTWSANLLNAALPTPLLPAVPAANDFILFGIDTTVADSGPFSSLVFDIGTVIGVGTGITIEWRYSTPPADTADPATWDPLTVQDNTNAAGAMTGDAFDTLDINSVHWEQPSDWYALWNPNPGVALGVTGFWVCAYVTIAGGATTPPQQANRDIYTVTWPYIDIDADQVGGDMPALLRLSVDSRSAQDGISATTDLWCQRILAGLRSYDRGENFTAFINLADEQNNADITITLGADTTFQSTPQSPTGRTAYYSIAAADAMEPRVYARLTPDFYGRFHAFVRGWQSAGVADTVNVRLGYAPTDSAWPSEKYSLTRQFLNTNDDQLLDFGEITLGPSVAVHPLEVSHTYLIIEAECIDAGGCNVAFYELILIPVDEWAVDSEDILKNTGSLGYTNDYWSHWEGDGIRNQRNILSFLIGTASDKIARYWRPITNGIPILQTGKHQRLWLLASRNDPYDDADNQTADSEICHTVQVWRNQRYSTLRGDQ